MSRNRKHRNRKQPQPSWRDAMTDQLMAACTEVTQRGVVQHFAEESTLRDLAWQPNMLPVMTPAGHLLALADELRSIVWIARDALDREDPGELAALVAAIRIASAAAAPALRLHGVSPYFTNEAERQRAARKAEGRGA